MPLHINYTTGYAGTGKSHSLIQKVKELPLDTMVVLAPTHKALHRLGSHLPPDVEIKTIHSLLGWIPSINENATHINYIDSTTKLDKELEDYENIIIDEAGMMSEDMLMEITSKIEERLWDLDKEPDVTLHLYLDPYQLLPVKGVQINTDPEATTHLTKQYRAESPDVVELYTKFVHYIEGIQDKDLTTPYSANVKPLDLSKFKQGDRLLAYTNKAVGAWNNKIAEQLGIKDYIGQEVQLGSLLDMVQCEDFIEPKLYQLIKWFDTGELKLQNSKISKQFIDSSLNQLLKNEYIQFIRGSNGFVYPVVVGTHRANTALKEAKLKALEDKRNFKDVYALGRAYTMDYGFATTVHKSQGSEFNTVFVDKKDIQKSIMNGYYKTYARLMYVAISRCKKTLYI